jgi:hypothetical protein
VMSVVHTGGLQQICGKNIFPGYLLRFGFIICMVIGGQGCPHILVIFVLDERTRLSSYLVILYWLGGLVFPSGFLNLIRLQEHKYCVSYVLMIHL